MGAKKLTFFRSIKGKILIPVIIILAVLGVASYIGISMAFNYTRTVVQLANSDVFNKTMNERVSENINLVYSSINTIADRALQEAALFTKLDSVQKAYEIALSGDIEDENSPEGQEAREMLRKELKPFIDGYKEQTGRSLLKLHFHLPNSRSLVRLWRDGYQTTRNGVKVDISDDISSFRNTLLQINQGSNKPIKGIEIGRGGFAIRGIAAISSTDGKHLGSNEVLFDFMEIFEIVKTSSQLDYALYMDADQLTVAKSLTDPEKYPVIDNTYVLTDATNRENSEPLVNLELLNKGRKEPYSEEKGNYMVSTFPIFDFSGKVVGVMFQSMNITSQLADFADNILTIKKLSNTVTSVTGIAFLVVIAILTVIIIVLINRMITPLTSLNKYAGMIADGNFNFSIEDKLTAKKDETGVLSKSFSRVIESLKYKGQMVEEVAKGNLTIDVKLASDKDVLGTSLIQMTDSLNNLLGQINMSVDQVNIGADQVSQASQSLSQGATESASSLEEVSASVTQVNSQSRQNAENATEANGIAKQAALDAEKGNSQMAALTGAMEKINTSSDQIKKIVKVIDDIAFQTNLLALNANVEAARAGKYGKGFAVVADEVRNLAVRSAEAVKETTVMVEESIKNIVEGNKSVEATAVQLKAIMGGSSKVADFLEEIATASKEQAEAIDQITQGLEQIDQVTQSNTASAEESAAAAEELASQSIQLKNMVATFKLKSTQNAPIRQPGQLEYQAPRKALPAKGQNSETAGSKDIIQADPASVIALDDEDFDRF
ncbi:MAG: methyl-accepting chemotaxis protein [Spirochaetia bacterium]|jgi:methyl-accepting chemotaxis protein|nr:methyl-accepting chemotaxis protein [Spirochaetia bacterium]